MLPQDSPQRACGMLSPARMLHPDISHWVLPAPSKPLGGRALHPCWPNEGRGQAPAFHDLFTTLHSSRGQTAPLLNGCLQMSRGPVQSCLPVASCRPCSICQHWQDGIHSCQPCCLMNSLAQSGVQRKLCRPSKPAWLDWTSNLTPLLFLVAKF